MKSLFAALPLIVITALPALAQDADSKPDATSGKKPSEILAIVEGRSDFMRLDEMSWNDDGYYEIVYRTNDKAKVEINIDAVSGKPVDKN